MTTDSAVFTVSDITVEAGQTAHASLELQPLGAWKLSTEYPIRVSLGGITLSSPPWLEYTSADPGQTLMQATSGGLRLDIPFTGDAPGTDVVTARVQYALCRTDSCVPKRDEVSWRVTVTSAAM